MWFRSAIDADDLVGPVGEPFQVFALRAAAEDQDRLEAELHAAEDVGLHRVADHDRLVGRQAQLLAGRAQHDGARLADAERLDARRRFEHGDDRAAAGPHAVLRRAVRIEIRRDELRAAEDHPQRGLDHFEVERAPFADDDVVGIVVDDRVAVAVQGVEQAPFADDEGRAVRLLPREVAGRRHRAGEDVLLFDVDAEPLELRRRRRAASAGCCW